MSNQEMQELLNEARAASTRLKEIGAIFRAVPLAVKLALTRQEQEASSKLILTADWG